MYLLSIYIPIFNHGKIIRNNLLEAAKQIRDVGAIDKIEIVLSDNCSTDNTENEIRLFMKDNKDINICYIRNKENLGSFQNAVDCKDRASGEFIIMIGDDCFAKSAIRNILELIEQNIGYDFFLIKNNLYTDFEYIKDASLDDIFRNLDKICFIGNAVIRKSFFFNDFRNYNFAKDNFYPHMVWILEKIKGAKKIIDTRFVAINTGESWNYREQTAKIFELSIHHFHIAQIVKNNIGEKFYKKYLKFCRKSLYNDLRFLRWHKNRYKLSIHIIKNITITPKILIGLFVYSLPSPLFYLFRAISINIKYIKTAMIEMVENRKYWNNKKIFRHQNYIGNKFNSNI